MKIMYYLLAFLMCTPGVLPAAQPAASQQQIEPAPEIAVEIAPVPKKQTLWRRIKDSAATTACLCVGGVLCVVYVSYRALRRPAQLPKGAARPQGNAAVPPAPPAPGPRGAAAPAPQPGPAPAAPNMPIGDVADLIQNALNQPHRAAPAIAPAAPVPADADLYDVTLASGQLNAAYHAAPPGGPRVPAAQQPTANNPVPAVQPKPTFVHTLVVDTPIGKNFKYHDAEIEKTADALDGLARIKDQPSLGEVLYREYTQKLANQVATPPAAQGQDNTQQQPQPAVQATVVPAAPSNQEPAVEVEDNGPFSAAAIRRAQQDKADLALVMEISAVPVVAPQSQQPTLPRMHSSTASASPTTK